MTQYPAVAVIYEQSTSGCDKQPPVTITVQRADPSLMFGQADNVFGREHNGGCFIRREGGQVGTRRELAFAVNHQEKVVAHLAWEPRDRHYVKDIFAGLDLSEIAYIVWETHLDWYEQATKAEEQRGLYHGRHCDWEIEYTVNLPPKEGFAELIARSDVTKNVELTSRLLIRGLLNGEEPFVRASEILAQLAEDFERRVYDQGLKDIIHASEKRGMSGTFEGIEVMSWIMCGRIMVTIEAPTPNCSNSRDSFTIIGNEPTDDANFGCQSIYATIERATELVQTVARVWDATSPADRPTLFNDNENVKLAGMP